jgi:hypothetical protein
MCGGDWVGNPPVGIPDDVLTPNAIQPTHAMVIGPDNSHVALGGLVVSVLATGPKVRGFKPGRGRLILRVIKSAARLPSEGK